MTEAPELMASPGLTASDVSRRRMLQIALVGGGAIMVAALPAAAIASSKVAKTDVGYQLQPKGKARCDNCVQWQAPAGCKVVAGMISPSGWCGLYAVKA